MKTRVARWCRRHLDWVTAATMFAVVAGAALRLVGGSWGLPLFLHPDEGVIVNGALDLARRNSFEPTVFFRPDHLEIQLNYIVFTAYSHLVHHMPADLAFAEDPAPFYLLARTVTAAFGIGMIVVAYFIGRHFGRPVGAISAILVSLFPVYVENSHFVTPDIPLTFAFMVVVLACMRYLAQPSWKSLLVACLATSASVAIKYPGAIAALMIAVVVTVAAVRSRDGWRFVKHASGALAAVVGFLFLISPALFTNKQAVLDAITKEARDTHLGADGLGWLGNLMAYASSAASQGGLVLVACFALGIFWSARRKMVLTIPLWLGAVFWVVLSKMPLHWERWGLPMYITFILLGAVGAYHTYLWIAQDQRTRAWGRPAAWGLAALSLLGLFSASVATTARLVADDTRSSSVDALATVGVTAQNSLYEGYTPFQPGSPRVRFSELRTVEGQVLPVEDAEPVDYLVLSGCMYSRFLAEPDRYADAVNLYATIDRELELVAEFTAVEPLETTGFEITNVIRSVDKIMDYSEGGNAGCDIKAYAFPSTSD